jgi:hypothetical protein
LPPDVPLLEPVVLPELPDSEPMLVLLLPDDEPVADCGRDERHWPNSSENFLYRSWRQLR